MTLPALRTSLFSDVGEAIRLSLVRSLSASSPMGTPARSMVRVGDWPEDCCDAGIVLLRSLSPDLSGRRDVGACAPFRWVSNWTVRVLRPCTSPALGSIYRMLPSTSAEDQAAAILLFDAPAVVFAFANDVQPAVTDIVFAEVRGMGFLRNGKCVDYVPGNVTPVAAGECAGWEFTFSLAVDYGTTVTP